MQHVPICINNSNDGASGYQAIFHEASALIALKKTKTYMAAVSLAWASPVYTSTPNVPLVWASVETVQKHYFSVPAGLVKLPLEIAFTASQIDLKDFGSKGSWRRVSPDEVVIAWYKAVADDIRAGGNDDRLSEWLAHLLTTPATFHMVDTEEDIDWLSQQLRENIHANQTLVRTAVQRIFDIINRRNNMNKPTPEEMTALYKSKLNVAKDAEQISATFVKSAFDIWDRALFKKSIRDIVLAEESHRSSSVFNSVTKLMIMVQKAKTEDNIEWVFHLLHDYHGAGHITHEDLKPKPWKESSPTRAAKGWSTCLCSRNSCCTIWLTSY